MGRPAIHGTPMTNAERQQRHRAKLAKIVRADDVLTALGREYIRAGVNEQPAIRAGVKKLLARWERDEAKRARRFGRWLSRAAGRKRKKR